MDQGILQHRNQQVLYDKKWYIFLQRSWLFRYIPFIDGVFGSGSIALGNVTQDSDLDALICARQGRIFTARMTAALLFGLFGWRRGKNDHAASAADKVCLNHFSTPNGFTFSLESNEYWQKLYTQLVPVYGTNKYIQSFFDANDDWLEQPVIYKNDRRHLHQNPSGIKTAIEKFLSGPFGDWLEEKLKAYQVQRIERGLGKNNSKGNSKHYIRIEGTKRRLYSLPPRIVYTDDELDFHPDPITIEVAT